MLSLKMSAVAALFLLLAPPASGWMLASQMSLPARSPSPKRSQPAMQFGLRRAPKEIIEKLAPTNSGTGKGLASVAEIDAIWGAFEKAYGSRGDALEASRRNSQVLLPFINDPATITGANEALIRLGGKEWAATIIRKNPGVLACNPRSLGSTPMKDIEGAANLVSSVDNLPPNIKSGIPFLTFLAIVGTIGSRLIVCGGGSCGSTSDWDLQGGLGPQLVRALSSLVS